jgi:hypothetical protein
MCAVASKVSALHGWLLAASHWKVYVADQAQRKKDNKLLQEKKAFP